MSHLVAVLSDGDVEVAAILGVLKLITDCLVRVHRAGSQLNRGEILGLKKVSDTARPRSLLSLPRNHSCAFKIAKNL